MREGEAERGTVRGQRETERGRGRDIQRETEEEKR